jgi:hypothetical protein
MNSDSPSLAFDPETIASSSYEASYEECIERLALAVDDQNDDELEEVACLIGQLAVVIE